MGNRPALCSTARELHSARVMLHNAPECSMIVFGSMPPANFHCQMKLILLSLVLAVSPACAQRPVSTRPAPTLGELSDRFESLAQKVSPAVVHIISSGFALVGGDAFETTVLGRQRSGGSGVIVDPSGYILTNARVIAGARRVRVMLAARVEPLPGQASILKPQPKLREAKIVGLDSETDLAVLKIDESGLPFLLLGDSDTVRLGQLVFALGSPLGLENSVTMGIVSSVARQLEPDHPMIYIQTDAAINPGNSGGKSPRRAAASVVRCAPRARPTTAISTARR